MSIGGRAVGRARGGAHRRWPRRCAIARSTCPPAPTRAGVARRRRSSLAGIPLLFVPADRRACRSAATPRSRSGSRASVASVAPVCRALLARCAARRAPVADARARAGAPPARPPRGERRRHRRERGALRGDGDHGASRFACRSRIGSRGVVGADLYVRTVAGGDTGFFTADGAARASPRFPRCRRHRGAALRPPGARRRTGPPLTLVARPINARILAGFQAEPRAHAARGAEIAGVDLGGRARPARLEGRAIAIDAADRRARRAGARRGRRARLRAHLGRGADARSRTIARLTGDDARERPRDPPRARHRSRSAPQARDPRARCPKRRGLAVRGRRGACAAARSRSSIAASPSPTRSRRSRS